ncbi:NB-ARC domain, LRR domain containing protein [Parasponia andersonii]|uniref:NB-ARC domain, LRR domain containing protein n=1 Tax=Parasponia andersonii TaxID=3476 RepID=A0A2P5AQT1_PARAD|nr:NB-ARC domain, LRR domain containing protein [Parasponia andersonii]
MSVVLRHFRISRDDKPDPVEEDLFEAIVSILIGFSILLIIVRNKIKQYLDNYKWIRREWRLLDALTKDFQTANRSVDQIRQRANQVWESDLNLRGITQTLSEIETEWVKKEGKVSSDAQRYVEDYEKLIARHRGTFMIKRYVSAFKKLISIVELALGLRRLKREITNQRENKKEYTNPIVEKLEESRTKVRRLQDRPIDDAEQRVVIRPMPPFRSGVALVLERLIDVEPVLVRGIADQVRTTVMQLQLMRAFTKDIRELRLESEIEKAWVEEAQEITAQAQNDVNSFLQEASNHPRWLAVVTDYRLLRRKLKQIIKNVGDEFSHILETKQRYGFKFIKRDSSNKDAVGNTSFSVIRSQGNDQEPDPVTLLRNDLEKTRKMLKDEEASNAANNMRKACLELLRKMASEVEPSTETEGNSTENIEDIARAVEGIFIEIEVIRRIGEALSLLTSCIQVFSIRVMEESCSVVGLEEDTHELASKLTTNSDNQSRLIISIVGMQGIGKTTLAKEILNHRSIMEHFPVRHFVSVPKETDEVTLLRSVGNQILRTTDEGSGREYWINTLQDFFGENTCLVVLDNLRSNDVWSKLKPAMFSDRNTGTNVLITSRDKDVASDENSSIIHRLRLRTGEESWEFFTQMVICPSDEALEKLAKKVVARTGGLPLAILGLGYLLSGKIVTNVELLVVHDRVTQGHNQVPWVATWDTNKDDLGSNVTLGKCLSYFELFSRDSEISARRLVALWVAQGLAQSDKTNGRTQEKVAKDHLMELIDRNIIQIIEKKLNGKVLSCRLPGILRELWLASRANNTAARSWSLCGSFDRKLAYRFDDEDASFNRRIHRLDHTNLMPEESSPHSIMFFDSREGDRPGEDIGNYLSKAITNGHLVDLVVLDLEHVYKPQLPSCIRNLKKLKYLGLRWTHIESLPKSIGQLSNLQTLDLKKTLVQKLPSSIWKLKNLRNLHLNHSCRLEFMSPPNNLHKLSGLFVDVESRALIDELYKLNSLRKLRLIIGQLTPQLQQVLARSIPLLTNLQSLSLKSNETGEPQELDLERLNNLEQLSSLSLIGKLGRPSIMFELPQRLNELTLSHSGLTRGDLLMQMLGSYLPELKFLYFLSDSYCGKEMVFANGFPKLLVLKLWNLPNLEELVVEKEVMPKLRVFEIRSCMRLEAAKTKLPEFSSLPELKLSNMPEEYTAELKRTFQKLRHNLRIRPFNFSPVLRDYPRINGP